MEVSEAALVPLREQGIHILHYLDDWLILAQSQNQFCEHRDVVLSHLSRLGKLGKEQTLPDAEEQTARLTQERAQSVLNCLNTFKSRMAVPQKQFVERDTSLDMSSSKLISLSNSAKVVLNCSSHLGISDPRRFKNTHSKVFSFFSPPHQSFFSN